MNVDRIWTLLARKLAGETSPEELGELESLLKQNPDTHLKIQTLIDSWNRQENAAAGKSDDAYHKLIARLKDEGQMNQPELEYFGEEVISSAAARRKRYVVVSAILFVFISAAVFALVKNKKNSAPSLA